MTNRELIAMLKDMDPQAMIVVDGYEGGIEEVLSVNQTTIVLDINVGDTLFGPHELEANYTSDPDSTPSVKAIYLYGRQSRN